FGDEVDAGPGCGLVGVVVGPWAQESMDCRGIGVGAPATIRVVHEAEEGGPVFVEQSADGQDGNLDGVGSLAHRGVFPVVVTTLMDEPVLDVGRGFVYASLPVVMPAFAHDRRVLRSGVVRTHPRGPGQHLVANDGSAVVVDVVGIAVVGGAD